jgi:hypothetical protein
VVLVGRGRNLNDAEADSDDSSTERLIAAPLISFYGEGDADDLTAEQARDLAVFLSVRMRHARRRLLSATHRRASLTTPVSQGAPPSADYRQDQRGHPDASQA